MSFINNYKKTGNRAISCFIAGLLTISIGFAQTDNQKNSQSIDYSKLGTYVAGEINYTDGKRKKVYIRYDNPVNLQKTDNQLQVILMGMEEPSAIDKNEIESFTIDGHKWQRINFKGDLQFGIMHVNGAIKNFSIFRIPVVRQTGDYIEEIFWQKLNEDPIRATVFMMKFKKTLLSLIADYPELYDKVNRGESGYKGILRLEKIVSEYNDWYASEHAEF